jgi:hypothetical protein
LTAAIILKKITMQMESKLMEQNEIRVEEPEEKIGI